MTDTVVVGAGIGGLGAAVLMAMAGRSVTVYEQQRRTTGGGAALMLQPNGLAVLEAIGVADDLRAAGSELRALRLLDDRLRVISEVAVPGGPVHGAALVVSRQAVHDALIAAASEAGVEIITEHKLTAAESRPEGPVLHFGDRAIECRLVVGADGAASVVRGLFGGDAVVEKDGRRYLRAVVDWSASEQLIGEYWTRRGLAGLLPCGPGRTYWYATATSSIERAFAAQNLDRLRRAVAVAHPPLLQVVNATAQVEQVTIVGAHQVTVDQMYRDSVVLVGDAAHAMAPNLGQGANSALVDGAVLASELGRRDDVADALAAYDARRSAVIRRVQVDAERLARLAHFTRGRRLRNAAVRFVPARFSDAAARRAQQVELPAFRAELRSISSG